MSATPIQKWLDEYCQESTGVSAGVVMLTDTAAPDPTVVAATEADLNRTESLRAVAGEALRTEAPVLRGTSPSGSSGEADPRLLPADPQFGFGKAEISV